MKNNYITTRLFLSFLVISFIGSCSTAPQEYPGSPAAALPETQQSIQALEHQDTLYGALGSASGIELLSNSFIRELAADDRVRHRYKKTDIGRFSRMMQLHICQLADGPCVYTGDTMKRTHGGMNIQSAEFNAFVEALTRAMDTISLNPGVQNRLLAKMAPMRSDIVGQ